MRSSISARLSKAVSLFFAVTLCCGLIPTAAFAAPDSLSLIPEGEQGAAPITSGAEGGDADVLALRSDDSAPFVDGGGAASTSENAIDNENEDFDESNLAVPAATERVSEDVALTTRTVAQAESTRSYFLAQTLESTRTVPIVSANLPLDTSSVDATDVAEGDNSAYQEEEGDDSEDDPDSDDPVGARLELAPYENDSAVSAESTVIGSFTYLGMTFAVESGGESVALVAVDYAQLPEAFIEKQVIAVPDTVTAYGIDYYSVSRIADNAFASLVKENASPDYKGCAALFSDENLLAEAGIDATEVEAFLNPESDMVDIDGDGEADAPANPLKDCTGILAMSIPASVTSIDDEAFAGLDTLQYLVVVEDNPNYASYDGAFYDADMDKLLVVPEGRIGAVQIASSATDIDPELLSHCPSVTTLVTDPESEVNGLFAKKDWDERPLTLLASNSGPSIEYALIKKVCSALVTDSLVQTSLFQGYERAALDASASTLSGKTAIFMIDGSYHFTGVRFASSTATVTSSIEGAHSSNLFWDTTTAYCGLYLSTYRVATCKTHESWMHIVCYKTSTGQRAEHGMWFADRDMTQRLGLGYYGLKTDRTNFVSSTVPSAAYWAPSRKITWTLNGGSVDGSNSIDPWYIIADDLRLANNHLNNESLPIPERTGWQFDGWYSSAAFDDSSLVTIDSSISDDTVLYAKWTANPISITWDGNGAKWGDEAIKIEMQAYNSTLVQYARPNRPGYTFQGWFTAAEGGSKIASNAKVPLTAPTYYAQWKENKYTVVFDENGTNVTGMPVGFVGTYDTDVTLGAPTRLGYSFAGWNTERDGSGTSWAAGTQRNLTADNAATVTLYAQWAPNDTTVKLAANNGRNQIIRENVEMTWDATVPELDGLTATSITATYEPAPSGSHVFEGFYTEPLGGTQYYDADLNPVAKFTHETDTLYAHWRDKNDIHNHIYCSSGVNGNFDADGYAYGWTCPSWDTYVARVYVADSVTPTDTQANVYGVPETEQGKVSGKISAEAVKAGEYVLLAGGHNADGVLPTKTNSSADPTKIDAWWEITAKPGASTGTLRIHCDYGAIISKSVEESFTKSQRWHASNLFPRIENIILDHSDFESLFNAFNGSAGENNVKGVELVGNTFPPSATSGKHLFYNLRRAFEYSDNLTVRGLGRADIWSMFAFNTSLASLPEGFTLKHSGITEASHMFEECISLQTLPKGFALVPTSTTVLMEINAQDRLPDKFNAGSKLQALGKMANNKYPTYYDGEDSVTIGAIPSKWNLGGIERELMASKLYATWDARGGSFAQNPTFGWGDAKAYDCSRVTPLEGGTATIPAMPERKKNADGTDDALIGWYKKVPMASAAPSDVVDKAAWAEKRYLFEYEFVAKGSDAGKKLVDVVGSANMPTESIVYYALYESDADDIKSTITFKMNDGEGEDGLGATFKTIEGQTYGKALKADSGIPVSAPYSFDGFWTEPVGGTQYYGADGKPVAGVVWNEPETDVTLYAHWRYRIVFDANPVGCAELLHQGSLPTHAGTPAADATYQSDAYNNRYYYADLPNNDMHVVSISAIRGVPVKLPYAMNRTGYTDACAWSTTRDASSGTLPVDAGGVTLKATGGAQGSPAIVPGSNGTVTLYADWTGLAKDSEVTLAASAYDKFAYAGLAQDVTNESSRTKSVSAVYDESLSGSVTVPTMRGYSFLGYFAEPQAETVTGEADPASYAPSTMFYDKSGTPTSEVWKTEGDATLYAHYRQIPYTLSFSAGSNVEGDASSIEVFYGFDLGGVKDRAASKKGSTFKGWADDAGTLYIDGNGVGCNVLFGVGAATLGDVTLHPLWEGRTYTIVWHFDWNYKDDEGTDIAYDHESLMRGDEDFDGTITVPNVSYEDEIAIPAPETVAFDFNGWYRKKWPAYVHTAQNDVANGKWFSETDGVYAFEPEDDAHCPDTVDFYASWSADPHPYTITLKTEGHGSSFGGGESRITLDNTYSKTEDPNDIYAEANLPAATEPGWKFAGWVETTGGGSGVPYTDEYVERGTGNRVFEATWKVSDAKYSISFSKGVQVSGAAPYSPLDKVLMDDSAKKRYFDAEGPTDDEGALKLPELSAYETCGYVFDGWYRAKTGTDGKLEFVTPYEELDYADDATEFTGQELVNRAAAAKTENLVYMARWTPKTFEVRYKATSDVSSEMKASAYAPVKLSYEDTVTLESPVFEQATPKGFIFKHWEGTVKNPTRDPKMVPGKTYTIRDLVAEAGSASLTKRTEDGATVNTLWLTAEWDKMLTFTVPLVVNIVIDPERPEGTKVGEAWIETDSEQELFVESASLTRDADIATTLQAKGTDRSHDVYLTVVGDKVPTDASATPLRMNLGSATNVHRDLAPHGLGTLKASAEGKPGRVNLTYDLELREGVTDIGFRDFENLVAVKDYRYSDGSHMTLPVGRVFYTLSLSSLRTPALTD